MYTPLKFFLDKFIFSLERPQKLLSDKAFIDKRSYFNIFNSVFFGYSKE